ncbi:MAG TPA: hypothetical protein VFP17_12345 [Solirubrobacterales bacterium]|nr:hypothetical protein [Solirubrobacterales bacterium]
MSADKDILYKVAYDEAVRALSEQQSAADSFRTRAGLLLSSTALTTSFLGGGFLDGGLTTASWAALAAFLGVAAASLAILWPQPWEFTANPQDIIKTYIDDEDPAPIDEIHRELSFHMQNSYAENRAGLRKLALFFQVASGLLTLEVLLWMISIATD